MKRFLSVLFAIHYSLFTLTAQTVTVPYQPGVTSEGVVYFLPKTAILITVQIEKTTYTPGDFCKYADRYLRLKDVSDEPTVTYRITGIRQEAVSTADTNMSEEILAAGSTAKMAELTAQDIYEIRESRNLLVRGQADNMPKDGVQLNLMLNQLDKQDRSLTSLFSGTIQKDTLEKTMTIVPNKESKQSLLFRFSKKLGLVDDDDLAGVPYYIMIEDLHAIPMPDPEEKKKQKQEEGVYVNVPGKMKASIYNAEGVIVTNEFPAAQFGNVELLSGALFNKRYTTHLWINPVSGAIDRLEAEQPK